MSVYERATGHTFWPRNLIFGLNNPWDMRKKRIFLFFEIFIFTLFIGIFRFFPYITLVNLCFQILNTVEQDILADTLFLRLGDFAVPQILIFPDVGTEHSSFTILVSYISYFY